ncbi:MAG: CoA ester lyase, partial [Hyphomicrobiales bacterium]|nr:CoA ester lyase [Hyphomicrobiales bacterium]
LEDLARDIGVEAGRARRSAPLAAARALVPMAAAALGLAAIASPHVGLRDEAGLRRAAARARGDGFTGMFAVHPAQVAAIRAAFAPDDATLARARAVVAAFEDAPEAAVLRVGDAMADLVHLRAARDALARAEARRT